MKGCLQLYLLYGWKDFNLKLDLKLGPLDQQANASPTELLRLLRWTDDHKGIFIFGRRGFRAQVS